MVVNIISVPGVMSPEMVEKFQLALEKMAGKPLEEQVKQRKTLQNELTAGFSKDNPSTATLENAQPRPPATGGETPQQEMDNDSQNKQTGREPESVEGYKMEEMETQDNKTSVSSSGVQWFAAVFILVMMGIFIMGIRNGKIRD